MHHTVSGLVACCFLFSACLSAASVKGKVVDPSGAPVPDAQVSVVGPVGVMSQAATSPGGIFEVKFDQSPGLKLVVMAPGFRTETIALDNPTPDTVRLEIAPQIDSVQVIGSAIDSPSDEQGGGVSLIPPAEIRRRNEPLAVDLLRYVPGMAFNQNGPPGSLTSLFLRGGNSNLSLVQIDGTPVNAFGGSFDFAHIPAEALDHIEVIRGPQSAIYGPYANSGVINFVTRKPEAAPQLSVLAEGGTYQEHRFGITGTGTLAGFGLLASASRLDTDGPVVNSDYRNEDALFNATRRFGRQNFSLHAGIDSNEVGQPGPWGSDPKHLFRGINTISRGKNNFSDYTVHYEADRAYRVRADGFGSFFRNNSGYRSQFRFSFNKDLRGQGEARTIVNVNRYYTAAL